MRTLAILLTTALLAAGCDRAGSMPAPKVVTEPSAITHGLSPGMPYGILRSRLLLSGWLPLQNPSCPEDAARSKPCNRWLELQECHGGGECSMAWADQTGRQIMQVSVSGMPAGDDKDVQTAAFKITRWQLMPSAPKVSVGSGPSCPSTDFNKFLPAFAGQASLRRAFTAPLVRAKVLISDGDGDRTEDVFMHGDRPDVFDVNYHDGAFHHIGIDGIDPDPLSLDVLKGAGDVREVSYLYGSSEGRSFRFTFERGCWYLTGNPQPTGP